MHIFSLTIIVYLVVRLLANLTAAHVQNSWRLLGRRLAVLAGGALIVSCISAPRAVRSHAQEPPAAAATVTDDPSLTPAAGKIAEEQQADAVFLLVTRQGLQNLLTDDRGNDESRWEELQRAYAMIPISWSSSSPLPGVLREALSPAGVRILQQALSRIIALQQAEEAGSADVADSDSETQIPTDISSVLTTGPEIEPELANWVTNPGVGQTVVKSDFLEAAIAPEVALRDAVLEALKVRTTQLARPRFGDDSQWHTLIDISLSDQAVRRCIVSTDARTEVIQTAEGSHPMRQTFALVEIPADMERQVLNGIENALRQNRLITLCLAVGTLWLAVVFFSVACRATQSGSLLRKLATFPAMAFLIVPCLLACAVCLNAMINEKSLPLAQNLSKASSVMRID